MIKGAGSLEIRTKYGQLTLRPFSESDKVLKVKHAPVAQMDRALVSETKGRTFESSRAYKVPVNNWRFFFWFRCSLL